LIFKSHNKLPYQGMDMRTVTAVGFLLVYMICGGEANAQGQAMSKDAATALLNEFRMCPKPANFDRFLPMQNIDPQNAEKQRIVREYIELKRRDLKDDWDFAATSFSLEQFQYAKDRNYVEEYYRRAVDVVRQYNSGSYPFTDSLTHHLSGLQRMHDDACKARNDAIDRFSRLDGKLIALKAEKSKPWLNPQKRLPCPVMKTPHCRM
jgi:hypothetical protein